MTTSSRDREHAHLSKASAVFFSPSAPVARTLFDAKLELSKLEAGFPRMMGVFVIPSISNGKTTLVSNKKGPPMFPLVSASTPVPDGFHESNPFALIIAVAAAVATVSVLIILRWLFSERKRQRKFPVSSAIVFALSATVAAALVFMPTTSYEGDVSVAAVAAAADGNWYILNDGGSVLSPVKVDVSAPTTLHFSECHPETENGIEGILNCETVTAATSER